MLSRRNGFLLAEETLKMVVALIAITFLIYFLTSLYFAKINSAKQEQANRILSDSDESLKKTIENLNDGEKREFLLDSPRGWFFLTFTGNEKPNSCTREKCACICNSVYIKTQIEKCDEPNNGVCVSVQNLQSPDLKISIEEDLTKIFLAKRNGETIISDNPISDDAETSSGESAKTEEKSEGFLAAARDYIRTFFGKIRGTGSSKGASAAAGIKGATEENVREQPS